MGMRHVPSLDALRQDIRDGLKSMRRAPVLTALALATLALGVGATTAMFSVVDAVLLRPLAYAQPERLVVVLHDGDKPTSAANVLDWQRQTRSFASMGAAEYWTPNLAGIDRPEKIVGLYVTDEIVPLLGVPPLLGRTFDPTAAREVVIAYALWQQRFGGSPAVLGREVRLDGLPFTIVGVMPREFQFAPFWATRAHVWARLDLRERSRNRNAASLRVFARLRDGVTLEQARADVAAVTTRLEREFPGTNRNVTVTPLDEKVVGDVRVALLILLGAVACVLLIACANIAHLLLARGTARQRELAIRAAVGARRGRLIRQLLTESLLLAVGGGAAGLAVAYGALRFVVGVAPADIPRLQAVGLDARVLLFTLVVSTATGMLFGILPALQGSSIALTEALNDSARGTTGGARRRRLRHALIVSEFALALVLLAGAGLMVRSFAALQAVDPGFNPSHVLSMVVSVSGTPEAQPTHRLAFYDRIIDRVGALPGVESASAINHLPLAGDRWGVPFAIDGRPQPRPAERPSAVFRAVFPGYFETMQIPLLRGRAIEAGDGPTAAPVVIVNEFVARRYWPGDDPVGKRLSIDPDDPESWLTVVGVAHNTARSSWAEPEQEELYLPFAQTRMYLERESSPFTYMTLVVRTNGDPTALAPSVRTAIAGLAPDVAVAEVQPMDAVVESATARPRFTLVLLVAFAALAVALAAAGIYGVMSYAVVQRAQEIGIRLTLGATPGSVRRQMMGEALRVSGLGALVGMAALVPLTGSISTLLYGVRPSDPLTLTTVVALLLSVAMLATYVPARRATRIDPMLAIRGR
jgi:putative ABC transport system permease protein